MPIQTMPFDSAQHLQTEADIARYPEVVLEAHDPALRRHARTQIARAKPAKAPTDTSHRDDRRFLAAGRGAPRIERAPVPADRRRWPAQLSSSTEPPMLYCIWL
jgi:hypothetical protein